MYDTFDVSEITSAAESHTTLTVLNLTGTKYSIRGDLSLHLINVT